MEARRIGILGGTFNPPHLGHLHMARTAKEQLGLHEVRFIPTGDPPHKTLPEGSPTAEDRFHMTCLIADRIEGGSVSRIEIDREGKSYTADTMALLREAQPEARLWLIVGTDMLESFDRWKRPEEIVACCRLAALCRETGGEEALRRAADRISRKFGDVVDLLPILPHPVSSTGIREKLEAGCGGDELSPEVLQYIREKKLYHFDEELFGLREMVRGRISCGRFAHTMGCEETAARLARRWDVNERDARQAAILHDMTKDLSCKSQLNLCGLYGIMTESAEMPEPILHALTGAEAAARECGVPERVKQAIRWHTTGKENMTALEKIIYLSDMIEPGRDFPGVGALRELAEIDLDEAVAAALKGSIQYLEKSGAVIAPDTIKAYEFLKKENSTKG